jgi:hypothetical protein
MYSYVFYIDNTVEYGGGFDTYLTGKWELQEDSLFITYTRREGKRGIGKPHEVKDVPAVYVHTYDEYVPFAEEVHITDNFHWGEIVRHLIVHSEEQSCLEFCSFTPLKESESISHVVLPGKYTFASEKELTKELLMPYTKAQLKFIRNEIFARYGYKFKDKELKKYFEQQKWYTPQRDNVDKYLSERERKNIELLQEEEQNDSSN